MQVTASALSAPTEPDVYRDAMIAITEGRTADAEQALAALMEAEPLHAGAWLDLAMLYCATGNSVAAEELFLEIERRFAPPPPILEVIGYQRRLGCIKPPVKMDLTLRMARGFESNVNQGALSPNFSVGSGVNQINLVLLPEYLPHGDQFTSLTADWAREFSPSGATGAVQWQSRLYDHWTGYNTSSLFLSLDQPWRWGAWGWRVAGSTGWVTLNEQMYLQQNQFQLEVSPPTPLPAGWQLGLLGGWSQITYPSLSGLDAQWREARATLSFRRDEAWYQASTGLIQDSAMGQRPGGGRVGVQASWQGRMGWGNGVRGELGWQVQRWTGEQHYSPGLIDVRRIQQTQTLRAAVVFPLRDEQALILEVKDIQNDENISLFSYRNHVLQLTYQWQPSRGRR